MSKEYSFLDYIFGGLQINFTVGFLHRYVRVYVNFTESEGDIFDTKISHFKYFI